MKLWHRIALAQATMLLALVGVIVAGQQQVAALRRDVGQAKEEYGELQQLSSARVAMREARAYIQNAGRVDEAAAADLAEAVRQLDAFLAAQPAHAGGREHQDREAALATRAVERLRGALARRGEAPADPAAAAAMIDASLADVDVLGVQLDRAVAEAHVSAVRQVRASTYWLVGVPLAGLLIAAAAGAWQYQRVVRPIDRLRRGVAAMAGGDLSARVEPIGRDEVAGLAADFNRMADELERLYRDLDRQVRIKSRELAHAERLSSVGLLAAGVAHEINNPLSIIHGYAEEARHHGAASDNGGLNPVLDVILEESRRCSAIVRRLLRLASPGEATRSTIDARDVVASVVQLAGDLPRYRDRRVRVDSPPTPARVLANPDELKQVLLNLVLNALEATDPEAGVVTIRGAVAGDQVVIEVIDNGAGMDAATLDRVFDPFFTTPRADGTRGVGLGLSVSDAIARQHGGRLSAHSDGPGRGSVFRLALPAAAPTEAGRG